MTMGDISLIRKLITVMERGESYISLTYFTEAMAWWDEGALLSEGIKKETYRDTTFYITPRNGHAYLYHGSDLWLRGE